MRNDKVYMILVKNLVGRNNLEDPGIEYIGLILKQILKKRVGGCGLDSTGSG
jgi:hypothetical protein